MRTFLIAAIIIVIIAILAIASPFVDIKQDEPGSAPTIEASEEGITATAGEAPSFEVETGSVKMGDDSIAIETATAAADEPSVDDNAADAAETPAAP